MPVFGHESFFLLRNGEVLMAGAHVILSIVAGLLVLWLGFNAVHLRGN